MYIFGNVLHNSIGKVLMEIMFTYNLLCYFPLPFTRCPTLQDYNPVDKEVILDTVFGILKTFY